MLIWLSLVIGLLVAGETAVTVTGLQFPGAALGLLAMPGFIAAAGRVPDNLARTFDGIAPHAPVLFVPAAAGVVVSIELLSEFWFSFVAAIIVGTSTTLVVVGMVAQRLLDPPRGVRDPGGAGGAV